MEIVPYREWCDVTSRGTPGTIGLPAPELWLHHGAQGQSTVATANAYARHHVHVNGWHMIGYSFLVAEGRVLEGRGPGRAGAHTSGRNGVSHGVCLVGDYTSTVPADRDLDALVWLLRHGHAQGWFPSPQFTGGHRDAPGASTTCPGNVLHRMLPQINSRNPEPDLDLEQIMATTALVAVEGEGNTRRQIIEDPDDPRGYAARVVPNPAVAAAVAGPDWRDHVVPMSRSQARRVRLLDRPW